MLRHTIWLDKSDDQDDIRKESLIAADNDNGCLMIQGCRVEIIALQGCDVHFYGQNLAEILHNLRGFVIVRLHGKGVFNRDGT